MKKLASSFCISSLFLLCIFAVPFVDCGSFHFYSSLICLAMTIMQRSFTCLCAALLLCFGALHAQQPAQQRFLRFLGQRSVTTGTLLQTVEPFRSEVMTTASLVFAVTDSEGKILKDDSTEAVLAVTGATLLSDAFLCGSSWLKMTQRSTSGIIEFNNLSICGYSAPTLQLQCTSTTANATTITISFLGGYPSFGSFVQLNNGKYAVPGLITNNPAYQGIIPSIELGKPVRFNNPDKTDYNYIAIRVLDRFGNIPSFSTTVTLRIENNGYPYMDTTRRLSGNIAWTNNFGIAEFPDFTVWGTAANIWLSASASLNPNELKFIGMIEGGSTWATTSLVAPQQVHTRISSQNSDASVFETVYVSPNPASDALHIALGLPKSAPILIRIEDMLGRTVLRHEEQLALQGAFATTLDVSRLAQGAYTLHVQSGRERWKQRVVILR